MVPSKRSLHVMLAAMALLATTLNGCSDGRPERVSVTGSVSYQGLPVEGARLTFYCPGARPASGTTDTEGRFALGTFDASDGTVVGTHTVTITKTKPNEQADLRNPAGLVEHLLPAAYRDPTETPLSAEVTTDGENDFHFDLID